MERKKNNRKILGEGEGTGRKMSRGDGIGDEIIGKKKRDVNRGKANISSGSLPPDPNGLLMKTIKCSFSLIASGTSS